MSENSSLWSRIAGWLKGLVPAGMALLLGLYYYMKQKLRREEARHDQTKLEKQYMENEQQVERDNDGKSDADVVADAIREGRQHRDS